MKAAQRRTIADQAALLAVDLFEAWCERLPCDVFPEELLELQHEIEDKLYADLARVKLA